MIDWLQTLNQLRVRRSCCILVTVAETRGSVPREAGAKMVVTDDAAHGTLVGGPVSGKLVVSGEVVAGVLGDPRRQAEAVAAARAMLQAADAGVRLEEGE